MTRLVRFACVWGLAALFFAGAFPVGAAEAPRLHYVRIILPWVPQSQFAGYIMARAKGFYEAEGLDVRFIWGQPGGKPLWAMAQGDAEFAGGWLSAALVHRGEGIPLVNVLQLHQRSAMLMVTRKDITSLDALNGQILQSWGGEFKAEVDVFLKRNGIVPSKILPLSSLVPFLNGLVGGSLAMSHSEFLLMQEQGMRLESMNVFSFAEHGAPLLGEGLYTLESTASTKPDLVRAVRAATLKGWAYALANEDETVAMVMSYSNDKNLRTNASHQRNQLRLISKIIVPSGTAQTTMGHLAESDFLLARTLLSSEGYPVENVHYEQFFIGSRE